MGSLAPNEYWNVQRSGRRGLHLHLIPLVRVSLEQFELLCHSDADGPKRAHQASDGRGDEVGT
jgi:hypothetical protein